MKRGVFNSLSSQEAYKNSEKTWLVTLLRSDMIWNDLVVNPDEVFDTRGIITEKLRKLKEGVKEEKRFIYFICSRKKVRFDKNKKPKLSLFGKKLRVPILVGEKERAAVVTIPLLDLETGCAIEPYAELTDRFITLTKTDGNKKSFSVHDFLGEYEINIGYETCVQYVGITKNPDTRLNGHKGLTTVLSNVSSGDNDFFTCFNLFKVEALTTGNSFMKFWLPNSATDEIDVKTEGNVLEKCFIFYFDSDNQFDNRSNERRELENNLLKLKLKNKIQSVRLLYETTKAFSQLEELGEYYKFCSSKIAGNHRHSFAVEIENRRLKIRDDLDFVAELNDLLGNI